MENRKGGPDKTVVNRTIQAHGQSWRTKIVDFSKADPDAPAPSGEKLQDLLDAVRKAKPALYPKSRRRRV